MAMSAAEVRCWLRSLSGGQGASPTSHNVTENIHVRQVFLKYTSMILSRAPAERLFIGLLGLSAVHSEIGSLVKCLRCYCCWKIVVISDEMNCQEYL